MRFYLGVHRPHWLWDERVRAVPLFLSHHQLKTRKSPYPRAVTRWALDSGGFSELDRHHHFETTPEEYVAAVRRYASELGSMDFASPQDWMCEPWMIAKTGLSIVEHQHRTVQNFLTLTALAPEQPFIPVIQGWEMDDYLRCIEMYRDAGVELSNYPTVGVGSVCRRQSTAQIGEIFEMLRGQGLNMHGFGVKKAGLDRYGANLTSADSMAWSYRARRAAGDRAKLGLPGSVDGCDKRNCANCLHFALEWRDKVLTESLRYRYVSDNKPFTHPGGTQMSNNRESWLIKAVDELTILFKTNDLEVPPVRISCGFPGGGNRMTRIGECWATAMSEDGVSQIFIHPTLVDPIEILATIVHELVHAIDDCKSGHKGAFVKMARAMGLEGKPTATHAGEALAADFAVVLEHIGEYPHAQLAKKGRGSETPKKQSTRMLKIVCPEDGYTARTTQKWLDVGMPTCPCGSEMETA